MAKKAVDVTESRNLLDFPNPAFPTLFADNALSVSRNNNIVKFYFARFDPIFSGGPENQHNPVAQVIMPVDGFVLMTKFFQSTVDAMVREGTVGAKEVKDIEVLFGIEAK